MRNTDENALREMFDAANQLVVLLRRPDAEGLLKSDRVFRHSVFFEFLVIGEQARPAFLQATLKSLGARLSPSATASPTVISN